MGLSSIAVVRVPPGVISLVWDKVAPLLNKAEDAAYPEDRVCVDDYLPRLESGEWCLLVVKDGPEFIAASILEIEVLKCGTRQVHVGSLGGRRLIEWIAPFTQAVKDLTKEFGCSRVVTHVTREGWKDVLEPHGFRQTSTTFTHFLGD